MFSIRSFLIGFYFAAFYCNLSNAYRESQPLKVRKCIRLLRQTDARQSYLFSIRILLIFTIAFIFNVFVEVLQLNTNKRQLQ